MALEKRRGTNDRPSKMYRTIKHEAILILAGLVGLAIFTTTVQNEVQ